MREVEYYYHDVVRRPHRVREVGSTHSILATESQSRAQGYADGINYVLKRQRAERRDRDTRRKERKQATSARRQAVARQSTEMVKASHGS